MNTGTELKEKTAIITGASRGIGKAIALKLARQGARLVLVARNQAELESLAVEIRSGGGDALVIAADVTRETSAREVINQTLATFGSLDVLVNNAGIGQFKPLENFSAAEYDEIFEVNVKGTFLLTREVVPHLKRQGRGHIVSIASDVAKRTFGNGSVYCASKYAQEALTASLRKEVRPFGVKVSTLYPGLVDTYFADSRQGEAHKQEWLRPEDIAEAVWYVLSAPPHVVIDELMIHPISQDY